MPGCRIGDLAMIRRSTNEQVDGKIVTCLVRLNHEDMKKMFGIGFIPGTWWETTPVSTPDGSQYDYFHDNILFPIKPLTEDEVFETMDEIQQDQKRKQDEPVEV